MTADTNIGETNYKCILIKPIKAPGRTIGLLVTGRLWKETYSEEELRLYSILCQKTSISIDNIKLRDELMLQNITDPLTGLFNKRFIDKEIPNIIRNADETNSSIVIAVMDFENFKDLNDKLGHNTGDEILIQFAGYLQDSFRKNDICARIGGDEFLVVFLDCPPDKTVYLRNKLKSFRVTREIAEVIKNGVRFDVDIGFACFPHDGTSFETLFKVADKRMYEDKGMNKMPGD
jgi:diguanylate cyclase (GGDEF)-like protein